MNKKFLAILLCLVAAVTLCVAPITVNAEEIEPEVTEPVASELPEDNASTEEPAADTVTDPEKNPAEEPDATTAPATEATADPTAKPSESLGAKEPERIEVAANTVFTRIWEFFKSYPEESISVAGSFVLVILNIILKVSSKKSAAETKTALDSLKSNVSGTLESQNGVVGAVNNMIGGYNALSANYDEMKEAYDQYGAMEGERNRVTGAVLATNTAILEILTTVYANSKNLPQGVKDIVNLKYANCLKTLSDDEQLAAIVEAIRTNIGSAADDNTSSEEIETDAEV